MKGGKLQMTETENKGKSDEGHERHEHGHHENRHHQEFRLGNPEYVVMIIAGLLLVLVLFNSVRIANLATGNVIGLSGNSILPGVSASELLPSGVPKIYGKELGITFDDISAANPQKADATIAVLSKYDGSITLEGEDLQRYIDIASQISCEYCCGAESIIRKDGSPACGCAHSYSMRGLAKYLITKHGNEYTDDEILEELGKWKVLFFPDIHKTKAQVLKEKGIKLNYINLASNKYRGIEKGSSSGGGMVGGC